MKAVATGNELQVPVAGYYTATITQVDGRGRAPVTLELREFDPVDTESRDLDFVRGRLLLDDDEDPWEVLPGKGAPKRKRASSAQPSQRRSQQAALIQ